METAKLLVCVDGSRASLDAARVAVDLACLLKSRLRIVYVIERAELDGEPDPDVAMRLRQSGQAILERIVSMAGAQGVTAEREVLEGTPFEVILAEARRWKAGVIIMGRTGRTGPGRALLGSEAERVLEFSDRPVLIVPTIESHVSGPPPGL